MVRQKIHITKKISYPKIFFFSYLSSLVLLSTCVCTGVPTKVHLYMRIFLYINVLLCTNMLAKCVMHPKTYNGTKENKSRSAQSKSMGHKKEAFNPTVQN